MSDEKNKVTDKASEIARNIWLAGVGAYGKAVEDAQGRLEKAMEPPKLFKDLVKAGTARSAKQRLKAFKGFSPAELTPVPPLATARSMIACISSSSRPKSSS